MEDDKARINRRVSGESIISSYFILCTLESISCKFYEYVGNPQAFGYKVFILVQQKGQMFQIDL